MTRNVLRSGKLCNRFCSLLFVTIVTGSAANAQANKQPAPLSEYSGIILNEMAYDTIFNITQSVKIEYIGGHIFVNGTRLNAKLEAKYVARLKELGAITRQNERGDIVIENIPDTRPYRYKRLPPLMY